MWKYFTSARSPRDAAAPSPPAEIISEDAVSDCVCILLLSRKPVVVSSSRLFAPGRTGVTPRLVSYVRNRAFPVMLCAPMLYQNSPLIFPYSEAPASTLSQFIIRNRLPVFYICTLGPIASRRVAASMRVAPKRASRTIYIFYSIILHLIRRISWRPNIEIICAIN